MEWLDGFGIKVQGLRIHPLSQARKQNAHLLCTEETEEHQQICLLGHLIVVGAPTFADQNEIKTAQRNSFKSS